MSEERDFQVAEPTYGSDVSPEAAAEALAAWREGKPYTRIRPLQKGERYSGKCSLAVGKAHLTCDAQVEAVQFSSYSGQAFLYCEEHALEENDWENGVYYGAPPVAKELPPEWHEEVAQIMRKWEKERERKRRKENPEEEEVEPS